MHLTLKRIASAALVLILVSVIFTPAPRSAEAQAFSEADAIIETALQHDGTHGGQCWTFVRDVVEQATGRSMGFDYRQGFFDAGAIEVDPANAQPGDILQISNPQDSSSYYPGMHTAIVLENLGGGSYLVVDSNYQWDEWVSVHEWSARDYTNLQLFAYRFGAGGDGGGVVPAAREDEEPAMLTDFVASAAADSASGELPPEDAPADGGGAVDAPPPASTGTYAIVGPGTCLNLREGAGLDYAAIDCLPAGSGVTITGDPVTADGHAWVQVVTTSGVQGWVAADYLDVQAPEPEPGPVTVASAPVSETRVLTSDQAVVATDDGTCLNLRTAAGTSAESLDCLGDGTRLNVVEAGVAADGLTWSQVTTASGQSGWVASQYLTAAPAGAAAASTGTATVPLSTSTFAAEVERWRSVVAAAFPAAVVDDVLSVIGCQSGGDPDATGASGEQGLLQIHPTYHQATAVELFGAGASLYDPAVNLGVAAQMSDGGTDWSPWACQP